MDAFIQEDKEKKILEVEARVLSQTQRLSSAASPDYSITTADVTPETDSQTREDKNNVPSLDDAVKELNWKLTGEPEAAPSEHFSPQSESLPPVEECRVYREHDCGDHQVRGIGEQV